MSPSNTASTAKRLALKDSGFVTSDEVAAVIRGGVAAKLADAVMAALGSRFEQLAHEDVCTPDLYTAAPSAVATTTNAVMAPEGQIILAE